MRVSRHSRLGHRWIIQLILRILTHLLLRILRHQRGWCCSAVFPVERGLGNHGSGLFVACSLLYYRLSYFSLQLAAARLLFRKDTYLRPSPQLHRHFQLQLLPLLTLSCPLDSAQLFLPFANHNGKFASYHQTPNYCGQDLWQKRFHWLEVIRYWQCCRIWCL